MVEAIGQWTVESMRKRITDDSNSKQNAESNNLYEGIYVFCSIDIVNSTVYKTVDSQWMYLLNDFYDKSMKKMEDLGFYFWKYIGDEVLFYKKLGQKDLDKLDTIPEKIFNVIQTIKEEILLKYVKANMIFSLKGTLWLARIEQINLDDKEKNLHKDVRNLMLIKRVKPIGEDIESREELPIIDFVGPDIDLGFRISKNAKKNQLLVSTEFIMLQILHKKSKKASNCMLSNYRILSEEPLKGIWHERPYPIVMFRPNWDDSILEYDEDYIEEETLRNNNVDKRIEQIYNDLRKTPEIEEYIEILNNKDRGNCYGRILVESPTDIHIAAILFNKNKEVMLLKRSQKQNKPYKFDFGCTNGEQGKSFEGLLEEYYNNLLPGADITYIFNKQTNKLKPVGVYEYQKSAKLTVNGILFTGVIENYPRNNEVHGKYESFRFEDVNNLKKENLFENSIEHVKLALSYIEDEKINLK